MIKEEMVRKSANLSTVLILVATTACWLTMVLNSYAESAADGGGTGAGRISAFRLHPAV